MICVKCCPLLHPCCFCFADLNRKPCTSERLHRILLAPPAGAELADGSSFFLSSDSLFFYEL